MIRVSFFIISIVIFNSVILKAQDIKSSVFRSNNGAKSQWLFYENNSKALYNLIAKEAFTMLDNRSELVSKIQTKDEWIHYQNNLKSKLFVSLNQFEKTPLNAKITGTIEKETFNVEKIYFESHPGFYVTAGLFIPKKRQNPAPCIIYCSGHTELGFRSETYQNVILNLVEKGFIVFAFDPIGQGERLQYADPETGKSKIGGPTTEHSYAGIQTLLSGISLSDYFIWDGVRAIDYLETRKEVNMKRLGITGRSGGGTQSAMIAAYDDRIFAAAPECYITNFKRLLQSIGPQDAEQNPYNAIKMGFDHPDFLHLRTPKPTLIITTTHDYFSQQGARETFAEAQKSYSAFEALENLQMVEDFGVHESTKSNRESMYAFFQKYLKLPGDKSDKKTTPFPVEELWVTETGQIGTSLKGETVFGLNRKYFSEKEISAETLKAKVKEISGIDFSRELKAAVFTGKIKGDSFEVEKYFLENDRNDYALPVLSIKKVNTETNKILLWLSERGKEKVLNDSTIVNYLDAGYCIITADLPGIGELFDPEFSGDGFIQKVPFNYTFGANLIGKSISGIQTDAIDLLMQFVEKQNTTKPEIHALIENESCSPFLHYTAFTNPFSKIVLLNPLESNFSLTEKEYYNPNAAYSVVPGSLPFYDFKDLISFLSPKSFEIIHQIDTMGNQKSNKNNSSEIIDFLRNQN